MASTFVCATCNDGKEMDTVAQVKEHLATVHGVTELSGTRRMKMHMDGRDWYGGVDELNGYSE